MSVERRICAVLMITGLAFALPRAAMLQKRPWTTHDTKRLFEAEVKFDKNQTLVTAVSGPIYPLGGDAGLNSARTPVGAIAKVATMTCLASERPERLATCHAGSTAKHDSARRETARRENASMMCRAPGAGASSHRLALNSIPLDFPLYIPGALLGPVIIDVDARAGGKAERVCDANN
jgi:hypothetical protein